MVIRARHSGQAACGLLILACAGQLPGCSHFRPQPISPEASIAGFESRSLEAPALRTFLEANQVTAPTADAGWSLEALTLTAVYYQPALAEARARLLAAQAARITADERPNPSLSVTPGYDAGVPGAVHPWIVPLSLDWPIETAGKRGYRLAEAQHLAAAARWDLVGMVWRARSRLRDALLELYAAERAESLLARGRVDTAADRPPARGPAPGGEYLELRGGRGSNRVGSYDARETGRGGSSCGNRASPSPPPSGCQLRALDGARLSFGDLQSVPLDLTRPQARQQALLDRADVRAALERYAASQSALQLQIARQWPDIDLGPGFEWNPQLAGDREWELGVSLPLPIRNRNQGPIAEAKAQRALAGAHFLTVQAAALTEIDGSLAAYDSARSQLTTADSLLRGLEQQLSSVNAQVAAGELQALDLANARLAYEAGGRDRLDAQVHTQQALGPPRGGHAKSTHPRAHDRARRPAPDQHASQ